MIDEETNDDAIITKDLVGYKRNDEVLVNAKDMSNKHSDLAY